MLGLVVVGLVKMERYSGFQVFIDAAFFAAAAGAGVVAG